MREGALGTLSPLVARCLSAVTVSGGAASGPHSAASVLTSCVRGLAIMCAFPSTKAALAQAPVADEGGGEGDSGEGVPGGSPLVRDAVLCSAVVAAPALVHAALDAIVHMAADQSLQQLLLDHGVLW